MLYKMQIEYIIQGCFYSYSILIKTSLDIYSFACYQFMIIISLELDAKMHHKKIYISLQVYFGLALDLQTHVQLYID